MSGNLTPRWYPLKPHPTQMAWMKSNARFNVVPAGRRSGKTERAKRKLIMAALTPTKWDDPRYFAAAPTRDQAKNIWWADLKALSPPEFIKRIWEGELIIEFVNGARICVLGMDKPQRIEGQPWNGGVLDEYADMKPEAWTANVRPALSDRKAWCDLIGVPEGRNHYYETYIRALEDTTGEWAGFTWKSSDILPPEEVESARRDLDPLMFQQEYEASFVNFSGRVYHCFDRDKHCSTDLKYNPNLPLVLCFDFNVAPGVAAICQEVNELPNGRLPGTAVIGEVYIPKGSNTKFVCNRIIHDWGKHKGLVFLYGDATGGAPGSARVEGSDWDLIRKYLRSTFGENLRFMVPSANPAERARVNAVNSRLLNASEQIHMMVNPKTAPHVVKDLEGVRVVEGGSGEIDKDGDKTLSHISDALGYYIHYKFRSGDNSTQSADIRI
jgi:hypothetical protein